MAVEHVLAIDSDLYELDDAPTVYGDGEQVVRAIIIDDALKQRIDVTLKPWFHGGAANYHKEHLWEVCKAMAALLQEIRGGSA